MNVRRPNILLFVYRAKSVYFLSRWDGPLGGHSEPPLTSKGGAASVTPPFAFSGLRGWGRGSLPGAVAFGGVAECDVSPFKPVFGF